MANRSPAKNITDLTGRVAVVIGGTSGLGRAIAIGLAESGADVVPSGRRAEVLPELCDQIESLGRRTLRHPVDVLSRPSIDGLRDAVVAQLGGVDILVNAAGRMLRKLAVDITEAELHDVMDTNLTGMLRACQSFHGPLKRSGRGRVINLASATSYVAYFNVAAYGASKGAVMSLTQSLCVEWAADRINVNALVPGVFPTEINRAAIEGTPRGQEILMRTPMKRFGLPNEIVGAAVFLASDAASFVNGHGLIVDGGVLASGVNA